MGRRTAKRGFGSIRKLPSGNFQARYSFPTGEMVSAPATVLARIDAEAWLHEERRRLENPEEWRSPKARLEHARTAVAALAMPTFEEYAERWINTRRTILNTAVDEDELLERNPARIRGGGARPSKKHVRPASLDELETMVETMPRSLAAAAPPCDLVRAPVRRAS